MFVGVGVLVACGREHRRVLPGTVTRQTMPAQHCWFPSHELPSPRHPGCARDCPPIRGGRRVLRQTTTRGCGSSCACWRRCSLASADGPSPHPRGRGSTRGAARLLLASLNDRSGHRGSRWSRSAPARFALTRDFLSRREKCALATHLSSRCRYVADVSTRRCRCAQTNAPEPEPTAAPLLLS